MISKDIRIEGFDARSWTNLVSLFAPPVRRHAERPPTPSDAPELDLQDHAEHAIQDEDDEEPDERSSALKPQGSLLIVVSARGRVRKALHTTRGRTKGVRYESPLDLERLARETGARRAVALRDGALEEIAAKIERRVAREDDYVAAWLQIARAYREAVDEGAIHVWPKPQFSIPVPSSNMVRRALDLVLPDDTAMTLVAFEGGGLWTAAALRRREGAIDWVCGPDLIAKWAGELGGDWRRDHRAVSDAVARHVAPVHFGVFAEAHVLEDLLRSRAPGAWAAAVARRDVIVQPTPPYVAVALGADTMRAVAKRSSDALGGIDAFSLLTPLVRALRSRIGDVASVTATLGFDPLKLLAGWLERHDPESEDGDRADADIGPSPSRAKKRHQIFEEDDTRDEHESAFTAEVLPFPGVRLRSNAPPPIAVPSDDEDDEAALELLTRHRAAHEDEDEGE